LDSEYPQNHGAPFLKKKDDFTNQISVLESVIREAGDECIFLSNFHCELNPIEMVSDRDFSSSINLFYIIYFQVLGMG
jgi:hypothetical protein